MTFKKYPEIERLGSEGNKDILAFNHDTVVIEEKVDGGNGSFWVEDDETIHFGSRNRDITLENDKKIFAAQQVYLSQILMENELQGIKLNPDYIYYIEWMQKHTIGYTKVPQVIGLDIRMKHANNEEGFGMFIGRESREQEFDRLGIENTPLVWKGTVEELKKLNIADLVPDSKYYDGKAEGIVIKNYCRKNNHHNCQLYAKVVRDEFKENNKAVFGGVRQKNTDTNRIIQEFATDARIRKAIHKHVNEEGMELNLKLMHKVPTYVIKDILKEEFNNIFDKYHFIDFKEMKQKVSKRCLIVINEELEKDA